jgi:hypothetical protein
MFDLAHQLLVEMGDATGIEVYQHVGKNPDKLVHAFGIFQYDLQFFKKDQNFFLNQGWTDITECVKRMMSELLEAVPGSPPCSAMSWSAVMLRGGGASSGAKSRVSDGSVVADFAIMKFT